VVVNGGVFADGQHGGNAGDYSGGSGGGSGGGITIIGGSVGVLSAEGGDGGSTRQGIGGLAGGGGGGGGGRIAVSGGGGTLAYNTSGGKGGLSQEIAGLLEDGGFPGGGGSVYHEGGITLTASGTCPGPVDIDVSGLTPSGSYLVIGGLMSGSAAIPSGACTGDTSGLGPTVKSIRTATADAGGFAAMNPMLKAGPCGKWLQIVDETTCALSNPVVLP
jgi:hypothetical protein